MIIIDTSELFIVSEMRFGITGLGLELAGPKISVMKLVGDIPTEYASICYVLVIRILSTTFKISYASQNVEWE
jgi:hypothetical protein